MTEQQQRLVDMLKADPDLFVGLRLNYDALSDEPEQNDDDIIHDVLLVEVEPGGRLIKPVEIREVMREPGIYNAVIDLFNNRLLWSVGLYDGVGELYQVLASEGRG